MLNTIFEYIACIADAAMAYCFIYRFFGKRIDFIRVWFIAIYCFFNISAIHISAFFPIQSIINLCMILVLSLSIRRTNILLRFIAPLVFEICLVIVNTTIMLVFAVLLDTELSYIATSTGLARIILIVTCKIVLYTVTAVFLHLFNRKAEFKLSDCYLMVFLPVATFAEMTILLKVAMEYDISSFHTLCLIAMTFTILSYIGAYVLVHRINKTNKYETENNLYRNMLSLEARRYEELGKMSDRVRTTKHDLKNTLLSLKEKIDSSEYESAATEINDALGNLSEFSNVYNLGNRTLDYIINAKLTGKSNIKTLVSGNIFGIDSLSDVDLAIILGNIVDNAVEATEHMSGSEIELQFFVKNRFQNIVCKNTIASSVLDENPNLSTTKSDKDSHGLGLKSVRRILEKYSGEIDFYEENGKFCVHIVFPF